MLVTRAEIAGLIPHSGSMCLLDEVVSWDENRIRCASRSHLDPGNPLRAGGRLPAVCGIEYAAQAMALHGSLAGNVHGRPLAGFLASVRDMTCRRDRLDDLGGSLFVEAVRALGDEARVIYEFRLWVGETEVLSGRAAVVLNPGGAAK